MNKEIIENEGLIEKKNKESLMQQDQIAKLQDDKERLKEEINEK